MRLISQQVLTSQPSASFPGPLFTKYEWIASDHCLLKGFVRIKSESEIHRKREPETMEGEGNFKTISPERREMLYPQNKKRVVNNNNKRNISENKKGTLKS